jgi:predicted sulfurtransferase
MKDYLILLYYCYTKIEDPEAFRKAHYLYCIENNLLGRIIVASEGINGTISGLKSDCEKYMAELHLPIPGLHIPSLKLSLTKHMHFKNSTYE